MVMVNPVLVWATSCPCLEVGTSYEEVALLKYLKSIGDFQTKFVINAAMKRLIDSIFIEETQPSLCR